MKIALCTSEAVPFVKTGGLADVSGALPLALDSLGCEVILIMPKYYCVRSQDVLVKDLDDNFAWAALGGRVKTYFVKSQMYARTGLYGDRFGDYPDNLKRFSYLCQQACHLFQKINFFPDVIHCNDWQTSLIPALIKARAQEFFGSEKIPKSLLTIHNLAYQGIFSKEKMLKTGLSQDYFTISGFEFYDNINLLKGGIQYADLVNTVSPTYADEVQTPEYGCGLEGVLKNRRDAFCGIINGVDYKVWNPQGDFYIFKRYSKFTLDGKKNNKLMLQEACGLRKGEKKTLLGFVGRTVEQKGIDLLLKILPQLCHEGVETVILGKGDAKYEKALFEMSRENPELIFYSSRFDECLAHRIYASSDIFLMPSRFEPCGIGQLISFKYGTIPIVYRTGGFVDTVMDYSLDKKMGRGFVFNEYNEGAFWGAIQRARKVSVNRKEWQALIKRVMSLDFSWKESAKKYIKLYEAAMAL